MVKAATYMGFPSMATPCERLIVSIPRKEQAAPDRSGAAYIENACGLCQRDIRRRFAAVTASFDVVGHFLIVCEAGKAGAFDSRNVHKHVFATRFRCDEAEAFGGIEPLYGAIGHGSISFKTAVRVSATARRSWSESKD